MMPRILKRKCIRLSSVFVSFFLFLFVLYSGVSAQDDGWPRNIITIDDHPPTVNFHSMWYGKLTSLEGRFTVKFEVQSSTSCGGQLELSILDNPVNMNFTIPSIKPPIEIPRGGHAWRPKKHFAGKLGDEFKTGFFKIKATYTSNDGGSCTRIGFGRQHGWDNILKLRMLEKGTVRKRPETKSWSMFGLELVWKYNYEWIDRKELKEDEIKKHLFVYFNEKPGPNVKGTFEKNRRDLDHAGRLVKNCIREGSYDPNLPGIFIAEVYMEKMRFNKKGEKVYEKVETTEKNIEYTINK